MNTDQTARLAIDAADAALKRAQAAPRGSPRALRAAIEGVWWIAAGAEYLDSEKAGTRLSAFHWVRNRGLHQTASLFTITEDVPGGYPGGYRGGYGGVWEWADLGKIAHIEDRRDKRKDENYDEFLAKRGVLDTISDGLADLRKLA